MFASDNLVNFRCVIQSNVAFHDVERVGCKLSHIRTKLAVDLHIHKTVLVFMSFL